MNIPGIFQPCWTVLMNMCNSSTLRGASPSSPGALPWATADWWCLCESGRGYLALRWWGGGVSAISPSPPSSCGGRTDTRTDVALPAFLLLFLLPSPPRSLPFLLSPSPPRPTPPSGPSSPATMLWSRCWWRAWGSRLWKATLLSRGTFTWWVSPLPAASPAFRSKSHKNSLQSRIENQS